MTDPRFLSNSVAHLGVHRFVHHCNQELLRLVIPNLQKTDSEPGDKPSSTAVGSTVTGGGPLGVLGRAACCYNGARERNKQRPRGTEPGALVRWELSAVLGLGPPGAVRCAGARPVLRRSGEGSEPPAGRGEATVPQWLQRGVRRWDEDEEGAGCPRGRARMV